MKLRGLCLVLLSFWLTTGAVAQKGKPADLVLTGDVKGGHAGRHYLRVEVRDHAGRAS